MFYLLYKDCLEAGPVQVLRRYVRPGTVVIDVGANIGYFTRQFATWVSNGGWVIAVEPEALNLATPARPEAAGIGDVVEMVQAAAAALAKASSVRSGTSR